MDVTATNVWWMQCERYHFVQIVSSMSKMHKLRSIREKNEDAMFHSKVSPFIVADYFDDDSFSNEVVKQEFKLKPLSIAHGVH